LHSCGGNFSITATRNAWVGYFVCLCYGGQELRYVMDGGGGNYIENGLAKGTEEVSIRGSMREKEGALPGMCFGWLL